jgi:hypothetical protein
MKKLLLFTAILIAANSFGQTILNGDFETWNNTPYGVPTPWYTSNPQSIVMLDSINCTQITGYSGSAVHLRTIAINGDTDLAYLINTTTDPTSGVGGMPYAQQSTGFSGYYRYDILGNDTAGIYIAFKKNGVVFNHYMFKITGTQGTWTAFNFTFTPALSQVPDTFIMAAVSSNAFGNKGIHNGSWLDLDDLVFTGPNAAIPDGNFDTWNTVNYYMPVGWSVTTGGPTGSGVTRSATHFSGNYAISLTTQPGGGGGGGNNNAEISNGTQASNSGPKGGKPYTNTNRDTLYGYYQYSTPGSDSAMVNVSYSKNGSSIGGTGMQLPKVATWTRFKLPFQALSQPDTLLVVFNSGTWGPNNTVGSSLLLDNVYLSSQPLGIENFNPNVSAIKTYPDPATNVLNIEVSDITTGNAHLCVYDITGKAIMENDITIDRNIIRVNIDGLKPGMYFYKITTPSSDFENRFVKE